MESRLRSRTPWREKMERPAEARIVQVPPQWQKQQGTGTMLIATPRLMEGVIKKASRGRLLTIGQIRERLAKDFGATTTCPLTTGIFARIVAEAANEELEKGKTRVTPFWRLIRDDGSLMEKFPGGPVGQAKLLRKEGHTISPSRGKKPGCVKNFEQSLIRL